MSRFAPFATIAAASALVLVTGGALAAVPVMGPGSSSPDQVDTTLAADASLAAGAAAITPATVRPVTLSVTAQAAHAAATPADTVPIRSVTPAVTGPSVKLGTKHGLAGTVTFTSHMDGGGRLRITGLGVPTEDTLAIAVYGGTATPTTSDMLLYSWTRDGASRRGDGSVIIDLTEAQAAAWHDARLEQGVLVRVSDGSSFGEATYAAK